MRIKCLVLTALAAAVTLANAQTALAENDATGSIGAVQVGNVAVTPSVGAGEAGATVNVSAPTSVAGAGDNTASNSIGAVQVGGGNTSSNSVGSVQSSPVRSTPSVSVGVGGNSASVSVPVNVGSGGGNNASNSAGAAQAGGGNNAAGSVGVVQIGSISVAPMVGASLLGAAISASFRVDVAGSGNEANDSIGVVQVGGGNTARNSALAAQLGAVTAGPTASGGGAIVDSPVAAGDPGSNNASGSAGVVQIGGGNSASGSVGTIQAGAASSAPSVTTGGTPATAEAEGGGQTAGAASIPATAAGTADVPAEATRPAERSVTAVAGNQSTDRTVARLAGQLPFTGLGLLLIAVLGMALVATGLPIRARIART